MAETERENIREATLEGLDAAAAKASTAARPAVITDDMLHTILRRRAIGETVDTIQPDLIIPTGKRAGRNPSVASIYRALAAHEKTPAYPEAVAQAHADVVELRGTETPGGIRPRLARLHQTVSDEPRDRLQQPRQSV